MDEISEERVDRCGDISGRILEDVLGWVGVACPGLDAVMECHVDVPIQARPLSTSLGMSLLKAPTGPRVVYLDPPVAKQHHHLAPCTCCLLRTRQGYSRVHTPDASSETKQGKRRTCNITPTGVWSVSSRVSSLDLTPRP